MTQQDKYIKSVDTTNGNVQTWLNIEPTKHYDAQIWKCEDRLGKNIITKIKNSLWKNYVDKRTEQ